MNNTVKNDFLHFPRYSGYSIQVANVQAVDVKFSQDLAHQKSINF